MVVYTIGHSNHSIERFIELLRAYGVTVVADVRSQPYSRFNPQFSARPLQQSLKECGISYVFLGKELGARSDNPACYVDGKARYELIAKSASFQQGMDRVCAGAEKHTLALLCAEKDPLTCHRTILVARHLVERQVEVAHILEDGGLESHGDAVMRLRVLLELGHDDLFLSDEELTATAYRLQGERIAFTQVEEAQDLTTGGGRG